MAAARSEGEDRDVRSRPEEPPTMNASTTALIFVGLLLTVIGLFVAGSIALIALGVGSLLGAGILQTVAARSH